MKRVCIAVLVGLAAGIAFPCFADAYCKSGNCIVNTLNLKLSAVSYPDGVHLTWTPHRPELTYQIYRDGSYLAGVSSSGVFDSAVQYGKTYEYRVVIKGTAIEATVRSTIDGKNAFPLISDFTPAKLWLEDEKPYNVKIRYSQYDTRLYAITKVFAKVDSQTVSKTYSTSPTGTEILDLASLGLKCSTHGEKTITMWLEVRNLASKQTSTTDKMEKKQKKVKVFFNKYNSVDGQKEPWFVNWRADGAVKNLQGHENGSYEFKWQQNPSKNLGVDGLGLCDYNHKYTPYALPAKLDRPLKLMFYTYPEINKITAKPILYICPGAASETSDYDGECYYGLECTAAVCAHELKHREMSLAFHGHYTKFEPASDAAIQALREYVTNNRDCENVYREYLNEYTTAASEAKKQYTDTDGDYILDCLEEGLDLTVGTKQSHGAGYKNSDVEYVAFQKAVMKCGKYVRAKDWAFPGSNMASDYEYQSKKKWFSNKEDVKKNLTSTYEATRNANSVTSGMARRLLTLQQDSEEQAFVSSRIDTLPDFEDVETTKDVEIISVEDCLAKKESGATLNAGVEYVVNLRNNNESSSDVLLNGYLVDDEDCPLVSAYAKFVLPVGESKATLQFSGQDIYASHAENLRLKVVTVSSSNSSLFGYSDVMTCDKVCSEGFTAFEPAAGYLMIDNANEYIDRDLSITVNAEICSNGNYEIIATLTTTSGVYVTSTIVSGLSKMGCQSVNLRFKGDEIFRAKQEGPFILGRCEMRCNENPVDVLCDAYTTAPYSYRDFASGDEMLFADADSFAREADSMGCDGLCDALNFSFAVTNLAPSTTNWVARMYLRGTNDELVCSASADVVLSNTLNRVAVSFTGTAIKQGNVEGPYYVSEVAIEDAETGAVEERFTPAQILIDRVLDQFGDAPVQYAGSAELLSGTEDEPFAVEVPISIFRTGNVTVSAVLVATNGTPVTRVESTQCFTESGDATIRLSFKATDIYKSGVRGPYAIRYLVISSDHVGTEEIHVDDLELGDLECEYRLFVDDDMEDDSGDGCSPETAKRTIRGALELAQPYDVIIVADGVYEPFSCGIEEVEIRSVNGPEKTVIDGEGQMRCAYFYARGHWDEERGEWIDGVCGSVCGFTLENGYASAGAGIYNGTARRCVIRNCKTEYDGGGAYMATLDNCILYGNEAGQDGGGALNCDLYNCTVAANTAGHYGGGTYDSAFYNSIVWGNTSSNEESDNYWVQYAEVETENSCSYPVPNGCGNFEDDPLLVDPVHGDMRLRSDSPCIDTGDEMYVLSTVDYSGASRIVGDAPDMGAMENAITDSHCISVTVQGKGTVVRDSILVEDGGSATISAQKDSGTFLRYEVGGEIVGTSRQHTFSDVRGDIAVTAVFKDDEYYVSPQGSDANDGKSWNTAKATIQSAVDVAAEGASVFVAAGTYEPFDANNKAISIVGIGGAARTIVDASGRGMCACLGGGYGENDTKLTGFTLCNGYAIAGGAGAYGGTLYDCVVAGNRAGCYGGGLRYSTAHRCVISNNTIIAKCHSGEEYDEDEDGNIRYCVYGGGAYQCNLYNSLIVKNHIDARAVYLGIGAGTVWSSLVNCTVSDNAVLAEGTQAEQKNFGAGSRGGSAHNSIFWNNTINGIVDDVDEYCALNASWTNGCPLFVTDSYELSENSPCVDAGSNENIVGDKDLNGFARIENGRVDLGAYEYAEEHEIPTYTVRFDPNGGVGDMPEIVLKFNESACLPVNTFTYPRFRFNGWAVRRDSGVVYIDQAEVCNLTDSATIVLYACWELSGCNFNSDCIKIDEGSVFELIVSGGTADKAASAQLYLAYLTAAAADLDLKTATVDGVTPKGGVKFPLTLSWKAGEVADRVIRIPVKADKTVEDDETLVFQLAAAQGQELGEVTTCAVTIRDANVAADYAAKQTKETIKTKKNVTDTYPLTVACVAGDGSGDVCGYTTGQGKYYKGCKASLKATARPGWEFKGWGAVVEGVTNIVSDKASWSVTLTNDAEIVALFGRIPYVAGLASPSDGGKVAGSGYCAAGKKVTLKATVNKNFTFTGWYTNDVLVSSLASLVLDRAAKPAKSDAKQTVITDVSESVTYYATFKSDPTVYVYLTADDSATAPGKVTGAGKYAAGKKKIALKATANKGYVFRGWYEGTSVDLINDVPLTKSATYTLAEMPTNDVEYTAGFITAETDKSYIAATIDGIGFDATHLSRATNIWAGVYLEWPVAASALSETTVKVAGLPSGLKFTAKDVTQKIGTGKTAQIVVVVPGNTIYGAPSAASKTAKDKKTGAVTVTPSVVKITVTTAGKSSQIYQIDTTVDPLPSWAVGTFTGPAYSDAIETIASTNGTVSVTIGASGKISAKQPVNGKSTSFAASYFDSYAADESAFYATLTAKVGKDVVTNEMAVCGGLVEAALPAGGTVTITNGVIEANLFDAWQHNWKTEPWKTLIKPLDKTTFTYVILSDGTIVDENDGGEGLAAIPGNVTGADGVRALPVDGENVVGKVSLKFAASGSVTVAGEFASGYDSKKAKYTTVKAAGSTIIVPGKDDQGLIFVYLTPKGISAHVRCVKIPWSEE